MNTQEQIMQPVANKATLGKTSKELIESIQPNVPSKGSNAGKQMYIINGKYWSRTEPKASDTHVCLQEAILGDKTFLNVTGFTTDTRMSLQDKIAVLTGNDAAFSMAIAHLLK